MKSALPRGGSFGLKASLLMMALGLLCAWLPLAQAATGLKSVVLPQAVTRATIVDRSEWQRMGVELEHLRSDLTLEATLEQLAMLLPEHTPVWSEQGAARAHWVTAQWSYALFLWATDMHGTEGLLSGVSLGQSDSVAKNKSSVPSAAIAWLPAQATELFSFLDTSNGAPVALTSYTVPITPSLLIQHFKAYAKRNGWLCLPDLLTFLRDTKRLSFFISSERGNTTVLVYETLREVL